jgi:hypothetical protein
MYIEVNENSLAERIQAFEMDDLYYLYSIHPKQKFKKITTVEELKVAHKVYVKA